MDIFILNLGCLIFIIGLINSIYMIYIGNILLYLISLELCSIGLLLLIVDYIYMLEEDISSILVFLLILGISGLNTSVNITILIKLKLFFT